MIHIAVCEDEQNELERLQTNIRRYQTETGDECAFTVFGDGLDFIQRYKPVYDVIFMDIDMPRMNGMEAARGLRRIDQNVPLVFITNLKQYALRGYEVEALDFLVKPIGYSAFSTMMARVKKRLPPKPYEDIYITNAGGAHRIVVQDIYYVEVIQHYIVYHTVQGEVRFWGSLAEEEKKLPGELFARCNKPYIVNLSFVKRVDGYDLYIAGDVLKISRGQKPEFMRRLTEYMDR